MRDIEKEGEGESESKWKVNWYLRCKDTWTAKVHIFSFDDFDEKLELLNKFIDSKRNTGSWEVCLS